MRPLLLALMGALMLLLTYNRGAPAQGQAQGAPPSLVMARATENGISLWAVDTPGAPPRALTALARGSRPAARHQAQGGPGGVPDGPGLAGTRRQPPNPMH